VRRDDPDVYRVPEPEALPAAPDRIVQALAPLVSDRRLARIREVAAARTMAVTMVMEGLADPHNASAILRTADAFGVQRVHVVEHADGFLAAHKVSKGADQWLDLVRHPDAHACAAHLKAAGYRVVVAAADGDLAPEDLTHESAVALVVGHERRGVSEPMRALADAVVAVPMAGFVESLNVSVATAVLLYAATRGRRGGLDSEAQEMLVARFLLTSVRDAHRVLRESGVTP
jgi:tRNA (guanosine-2'-O-)-methyltransferase